jgi:cell shape-determining protein MreC
VSDLPIFVVLLCGVLLLVVFVVRAVVNVRGFNAVKNSFVRQLTDRIGALKARVAALKEQIAERRRARGSGTA